MTRRARFFDLPLLLQVLLCLTLAGIGLCGQAWARDCPSHVGTHLFQLGDYVELGADFRAFYFGIDVGDEMPTTSLSGEQPFEHNMFLGLRPLMYIYPLDELTIGLEHEMRYRLPGWQGNLIPGFDHRPTLVLIEFEKDGFLAGAGLQPFSFGTGAVLDQRFMGLAAGYNHRVFSLRVFGGMTARWLMRNAANSMWMSYMSYTNGWKFTSEDPTENYAVGLNFSLKIVRPFRLQALYLYSHPSSLEYESHTLAIHFAGPIVSPYLSFALEPLLMIRTGKDVVPGGGYASGKGRTEALPGLVATVRAQFGDSAWTPTMRVGGASAFRDAENLRFASVFENLSWGLVRRFNLFQGQLFFVRSTWEPVEYVEVFADYFLAFPDGDVTDELDAGVELRINDLYRLKLAYVGMNLAGETSRGVRPSHALYVEARIVIGQ
jgi:hypothetical protein